MTFDLKPLTYEEYQITHNILYRSVPSYFISFLRYVNINIILEDMYSYLNKQLACLDEIEIIDVDFEIKKGVD